MIKRIFFVLILFILSLEITIHAIYFFKNDSFMWQRGENILEYDPFYFYKYKPFIINQMHGYPDKLGTDKYGFIYNFEQDKEILGNKINIFILGGSTVEGRGSSSNGLTIPSRLQNCLQLNLDNNINVINAGYSGFTVLQQINLYKYFIEKNFENKINYVIFFDGFNDAFYTITSSFGVEGSSYHKYKQYMNESSNLSYALDLRLSELSGIYLLLNKFLSINKNHNSLYLNKSNIAKNSSELSILINHFNEFVNDKGIGFMHIIQPYLSYENKYLTDKEKKLIINYIDRMQFNKKLYFEYLNNFFSDYVNQNKNNNSYDYRKLFSQEKREIFFDTVHYNDLGNKIIAEKICYDFIEKFN